MQLPKPWAFASKTCFTPGGLLSEDGGGCLISVSFTLLAMISASPGLRAAEQKRKVVMDVLADWN